MAKEFKYTKVRELGTVNENTTLEVGNYTVDGRQGVDKVYLVTQFTRRNGETDTKATAICLVEDAKVVGELLMNV